MSKSKHKHRFLHVDHQYLTIAEDILFYGEHRKDRTGTGTISLFSPPELRVDLEMGFPLLTTKKLHVQSIIHELLWFLKGDTHIKYLIDNNVKIWNADAYRWYLEQKGLKPDSPKALSMLEFVERAKTGDREYGHLGPIYGAQWRRWTTPWRYDGERLVVDQIRNLIDGLKNNPYSRRHVVSAWNAGDLHLMALPPCHVMFQCYVSCGGGLSLKMYQRL